MDSLAKCLRKTYFIPKSQPYIYDGLEMWGKITVVAVPIQGSVINKFILVEPQYCANYRLLHDGLDKVKSDRYITSDLYDGTNSYWYVPYEQFFKHVVDNQNKIKDGDFVVNIF